MRKGSTNVLLSKDNIPMNFDCDHFKVVAPPERKFRVGLLSSLNRGE